MAGLAGFSAVDMVREESPYCMLPSLSSFQGFGLFSAICSLGKHMFMPFSKFSPSGNMTVFLHGPAPASAQRARLCAQAIQGVGGEQAGYADLERRILTMGGGEFCGNACRAFGALLDLEEPPQENPRRWNMSINGQCVELEVEGRKPHWHVRASFELCPTPRLTKTQEMPIVILPGIAHALVRVENFPVAAQAQATAKALLKLPLLRDQAASGVIWWRDQGDGLEIMPFVHVPELATWVLESACGSGSLALAIFLGGGKNSGQYGMLQPSGDELLVGYEGGTAFIAGSVDLLATGKVWVE